MEYIFESFFWQISEDDKLAREWQVMYAENVDLTSNTDFINISPKPVSLLATSDKIQAIYFLERGIEQPLFWDDSKKIYRSGQEVYTANLDVRMFWSNSEFLYWLDYGEDIYRIALTDVTLNDWAWKVTLTESSLENDSWKGFVVEWEWNCFIAYWTKIYEINNLT